MQQQNFAQYSKVVVKEKRWSKEKMISYLTENPSEVHVTEDEVLLGNLGVSLGLPYLPNGGFFAFWVKPKRLKKYMED